MREYRPSGLMRGGASRSLALCLQPARAAGSTQAQVLNLGVLVCAGRAAAGLQNVRACFPGTQAKIPVAMIVNAEALLMQIPE